MVGGGEGREGKEGWWVEGKGEEGRWDGGWRGRERREGGMVGGGEGRGGKEGWWVEGRGEGGGMVGESEGRG